MECVGVMLPAKNQDACFAQGSWMGVADGVGQWMDLGVDSGDFARELMENCRLLTSQGTRRTPKDVIAEAVPMCNSVGSSTVVLACISGSTLHAANLGDSGFMVIRDWSVVESSSAMQSSFSSPLQVGRLPENDPEASEVVLDDPGLAKDYEVELQEGDFVVMATDGLLDYLFQDKIVRIMRKCIEVEGCGLEDCAVRLAEKARSQMRKCTPYFDASVRGLRVDDITILLARVVEGEDEQMTVKVLRNEEDYGEAVRFDELAPHQGVSNQSHVLIEYATRGLPVDAGHSHDAYFVEGCWMGVASEQCGDFPVSLWGLCGKFSSKLVDNCKLFLAKAKKPKGVIVNASMKTKAKVEKTSTLLVAGLLEGVLHVANVGNSRVIVIRQGEVVAATNPMRHGDAEDENEHAFDRPFVIGSAGSGRGDEPRSMAETYMFDVVEGDLIVCGSCGLFDNLYLSSIARIAGKCRDLQGAADRLAVKARKSMFAPSPRVKGLAENTRDKVCKVADITVILALVGADRSTV